MYPRVLQNLIECYKKLPGIGEKTAERLALASMELDDSIIEIFSSSLQEMKSKLKRCSICNHLSEEDLCDICKNQTRDHTIICVVEEPKKVISFEHVGTFQGTYHVLDGLISPLDGINPDDINVASLIERVKNNPEIKEVILAVNPCIEGETTALYISKKLEDSPVVVSRIACGVPMGADMGYIDAMTLEMALEDRKKISE